MHQLRGNAANIWAGEGKGDATTSYFVPLYRGPLIAQVLHSYTYRSRAREGINDVAPSDLVHFYRGPSRT